MLPAFTSAIICFFAPSWDAFVWQWAIWVDLANKLHTSGKNSSGKLTKTVCSKKLINLKLWEMKKNCGFLYFISYFMKRKLSTFINLSKWGLTILSLVKVTLISSLLLTFYILWSIWTFLQQDWLIFLGIFLVIVVE